MRIYKNDIIKASAISTGADSIVIKSRKQYVYVILVFSFLLKGAPACEGMRSLYLYNA